MQKFIITCYFTTLILTISGSVFAQNNSVRVSQYQTDDFLNSVKMNDVKAVKKALSNGISPNLMDTQGNSALALAITEKSIDVIKLLLDRGADLSKRNGLKMTAIEFAEQNNQSEIAAGLKYRWSKVYGKPYGN